MPPRRAPAAVAAAATALVAALALGGCSGGDDGPGAPTAAVTPTAPGDRPLVDVLDPGTGDRRVLGLAPEDGSTSSRRVTIAQEVVRDAAAPAVVPPVTVPVASRLSVAEGGVVTSQQTYAAPTVDATGVRPVDVRDVRRALRGLAGSTSTLVVRSDGTTVEATGGDDAAGQVDAQVREVVPVLPAEPVGPGASWTAASVAEVDGAVVDQLATYTLQALVGDDYVIDATIDQTYRPSEVRGIEVRSGRGTVTLRLEGSLRELLPRRATGSVASQVSYVVRQRLVEVRTTVTLGLTVG